MTSISNINNHYKLPSRFVVGLLIFLACFLSSCADQDYPYSYDSQFSDTSSNVPPGSLENMDRGMSPVMSRGGMPPMQQQYQGQGGYPPQMQGGNYAQPQGYPYQGGVYQQMQQAPYPQQSPGYQQNYQQQQYQQQQQYVQPQYRQPQNYNSEVAPGSRFFSNPYSIPPSNYYPSRYDADQYYVPPTRYKNIEPSNNGANQN